MYIYKTNNSMITFRWSTYLEILLTRLVASFQTYSCQTYTYQVLHDGQNFKFCLILILYKLFLSTTKKN